MPLDDKVRKLIQEALQNKRTATRQDLLGNYPMEFTVNAEWMGYSNPRVTAAIDATSDREVTHLKFTPVPEAGYLAVTAATASEPGAEAFVRGDSGRTGLVKMRAALNDFDLTFPGDCKLKLPAVTDLFTVEGEERPVVLIHVKRPARAKKEYRPRKTGTDGLAQPAPK